MCKTKVLFYSTFSRHGKAQASLALLIWLNENVPFHGTFSRHGRTRTSSLLLIWLNENVGISKAVWSQLHANAFVLSGLDYNFILDMVGFVHLHASMLIEAKTAYSHD